jgi:hypothetical protein
MNTLTTVIIDGRAEEQHRAPARRESRHLPVTAPAGPVNMWLPWRCRNWPSTPAEEHRFIVEMALRADRDVTERHNRSDVTAVLNALRGGLTADQLIEKVPGLPPHRLLAAYRDLEQRRSVAADAWRAVVAEGTPQGLHDHGSAAAALVPVLIERLWATAEIGPEAYRTTIMRLASYVEATHRNVTEIETALGLWPERAVELGARL